MKGLAGTRTQVGGKSRSKTAVLTNYTTWPMCELAGGSTHHMSFNQAETLSPDERQHRPLSGSPQKADRCDGLSARDAEPDLWQLGTLGWDLLFSSPSATTSSLGAKAAHIVFPPCLLNYPLP